MKGIALSIAASFLLVTTTIPKTRTFTGEIMDSQCAAVGSHGLLHPLTTERDCTIRCVRLGGQYALYNPAMKMAYGLDDQRRPEPFAGGRVEIVGTLDRMTNTIHVLFIRSAEAQGQAARQPYASEAK
jgi:hypothetical protein